MATSNRSVRPLSDIPPDLLVICECKLLSDLQARPHPTLLASQDPASSTSLSTSRFLRCRSPRRFSQSPSNPLNVLKSVRLRGVRHNQSKKEKNQ